MTISTQTVIEAFRETRATPVQNITYRTVAGEIQCCGIGAIAQHKHPEIVRQDTHSTDAHLSPEPKFYVNLSLFQAKEDLTREYISGFMSGWDEAEMLDGADERGYQDGKAAWEAVRDGV